MGFTVLPSNESIVLTYHVILLRRGFVKQWFWYCRGLAAAEEANEGLCVCTKALDIAPLGGVDQSHACPRDQGRIGIFPNPPVRLSLLSSSQYFAHSSQECLKFSQLKAMPVASLAPFKMKHLLPPRIQGC